ncbi:UvrD-like helicase C-terminal domain-containing protein [Nannocystis exedens]|uniref:DNA 3'-5' helicase II n=1 Tax=Nannocystis exedens TaxID=54 RepID=A0A1I2CQP7_9BACT|nr:ATP-binding domain-containing protein [Nannocystis exedens]PCC68493.1 Superfamily I DNA and RNA helicase-like protein [Nannocystis exedens]SFE70485.1 UvrD-like helicase C-terminal domain-containing protein [Nannocystis exedens]
MTRPLAPPESDLVAEEQRVLRCLAAALPEARYFGRLRVRTAAGERDVLVADRAWVGDELAVVDWRTAPLAEVFFTCDVGDDYELERDDRLLRGVVVRRHLVHLRAGELVGIDLADRRLRRDAGAGWHADDRPGPRVAPRPPAHRTRPLSPARVELDPNQRAAVELAVERSLLVLGEAGFGKTTVALHRLAFLARAAHEARRPFRALMLVPTPGLQRLAVRMLAELEVPRVQVDTFERWVTAQARRLFPHLPRRLSEHAGPGVRTFKRHPALRDILPRIVAGTAAMREVEAGYREHATSLRDLLLHLYGDRELLAEAAAAAPDELGPAVLRDVLAHTKIQFSATTERAMAHVAADRLQTLDGRPIDAGTPLADADTIDVEDFAVLFALHHRITGSDRTAHGALSHYQHILLDEAQELAPIELELLARAVAPDGTVTVAGDERQQVDASTAFAGWPAVLAELGRSEATTAALTVSYRCPPAIEDVARAVLDPTRRPRDIAHRDHVLVTRHDSPCHLAAALIDALLALTRDDPHVHVAVVCRHVETAVSLHATLARALPARLVVEDGEFRFAPGVEVTTVADVKGLEFDVVILPDLDAATYPDRPDARRALYVAATRPLHRLWLASAGPPSPLLPAWLQGHVREDIPAASLQPPERRAS